MSYLTPKEKITAQAVGGCIGLILRWAVMAAVITAVAYFMYTWLST